VFDETRFLTKEGLSSPTVTPVSVSPISFLASTGFASCNSLQTTLLASPLRPMIPSVVSHSNISATPKFQDPSSPFPSPSSLATSPIPQMSASPLSVSTDPVIPPLPNAS
jgi:hypothetical protein